MSSILDRCDMCRECLSDDQPLIERRKVSNRYCVEETKFRLVCPLCGSHTDLHSSVSLAVDEWGTKTTDNVSDQCGVTTAEQRSEGAIKVLNEIRDKDLIDYDSYLQLYDAIEMDSR